MANKKFVVELSAEERTRLDAASKQLVEETRTPLPVMPGQPARHDYEYKRAHAKHGSAMTARPTCS